MRFVFDRRHTCVPTGIGVLSPCNFPLFVDDIASVSLFGQSKRVYAMS